MGMNCTINQYTKCLYWISVSVAVECMSSDMFQWISAGKQNTEESMLFWLWLAKSARGEKYNQKTIVAKNGGAVFFHHGQSTCTACPFAVSEKYTWQLDWVYLSAIGKNSRLMMTHHIYYMFLIHQSVWYLPGGSFSTEEAALWPSWPGSTTAVSIFILYNFMCNKPSV